MNSGRLVAVLAFGAFGLLSTAALAVPCTAPQAIRAVRNTSPRGPFEYVIFETVGSAKLPLTVTAAAPPFIADPSGKPVVVHGRKFEKIAFRDVAWTCEIKQRFALPKTAIKDIKQLSQFEGVVAYVVGYGNRSRYLSTRASPSGSNRKVVMTFRK